jgi:hypothetical protein
LLVRDEATLLDVTHGGEECNFLRGVTVNDVIWKPVNRLEDLFFDAHDRILVETEGNPQWKANKGSFRLAAETKSPRRLPRLFHSVGRNRSSGMRIHVSREDGSGNGLIISILSRRMDKAFYLCCRVVMRRVFAACVIGCLFGCGSKNQAADDTTDSDAIKTPATVEQAARVLDLSTFPLMDGAKPLESPQVANLFYLATGDVKTVFEFNRKALVAQGWKEADGVSDIEGKAAR